MAKYIITPWRDHAALLEVRRELYKLNESSSDRRRHAVDRVMAWKLRGNLPHAVESTALLIDAVLHHSSNSSNSIFSIRAVYSAAFCRFVTGFCDIGRHKERSLEPVSMLDMARQIDMPAEFVQLRHEATHEELPNVQRLVRATDEALKWLWRVYWSRLGEPENSDEAAAKVAGLRDQTRRVLKAFRSARRAKLARPYNPEALPSEVEETCNNLATICENAPWKLEIVSALIVDERLVIPAERQLESSMNGAFLMWDCLLSEFAKQQPFFLPLLVQSMLYPVNDSTGAHDAVSEALCLWLNHLLVDQAYAKARLRTKKNLPEFALRWCCLHPGHWSETLGASLLRDGVPELRENWMEVFEASKLQSEDEDVKMALDEGADVQKGDWNDGANVMKLATEGQGFVSATVRDNGLRGWQQSLILPSTPIGVLA